jgi:hypothetical protein
MDANPESPMLDISRPKDMSESEQAQLLEITKNLSRRQKQHYPLDQDLEARIAKYELTARMQFEAMRVADTSNESAATRQMYALYNQVAAPFGQNCLLARRLIESGVRFVTLISGTGGGAGSDTHDNIQGAAGSLP